MATETILLSIFNILIYPGLLFLAVYAFLSEWLDRKFYAKMQNRVGPPWYQPFADFIKLLAKEVVIPACAEKRVFKMLPFFAVAAVVASFLMIPLQSNQSVISFEGDLIVIIYLLTIPTLTFFLIGWSASGPYSVIGSMRVLTQLFAYEVPMMLAVLGPAIMAGSWRVSEIAQYYTSNPILMACNIIGLFVAIVALQGKLERVPFDIPHSETEIVGGVFTEYSGRLLALMNLAIDMEMVVVCALINAIFLGGSFGLTGISGFILFVVKTEILVFALALIKSLLARVRIEQMLNFCWQILAPLAILQILINILVRTLVL